MELNDKIVIYQTVDGQTSIEVKLENETVWLSANQMAALFDRDEKTIRKHINNVFSEGELEKENNTHFLRVDGVKQPVAFYSLDVIISVGYRVKSQRGTQFRIWANRVLKEYLVKGYAVNKALTEQRYTELKQLVTVLGRTVKAQEALTSDDALNLVEVVTDYAYALDTLDKVRLSATGGRADHQRSKVPCYLRRSHAGHSGTERKIRWKSVVCPREGRFF